MAVVSADRRLATVNVAGARGGCHPGHAAKPLLEVDRLGRVGVERERGRRDPAGADDDREQQQMSEPSSHEPQHEPQHASRVRVADMQGLCSGWEAQPASWIATGSGPWPR
jgi:hypothetical protein